MQSESVLRKAAQAFLDAAALESMTKAPDYIRAKRRLRAALTAAYDAEQEEQPDPLITYTDPAGGPDWEPREDEA